MLKQPYSQIIRIDDTLVYLIEVQKSATEGMVLSLTSVEFRREQDCAARCNTVSARGDALVKLEQALKEAVEKVRAGG